MSNRRNTRRKKRRPNWAYRLTWLAILLAASGFLAARILFTAATTANRTFGVDWGLAVASSLLDTTVAIWFVAVGAAIGSFLNVVAYRLPLRRSIGGHSQCPYCQTPIDSLDNLPVVGWVKLRGRCRTCRLPISIQYPLVELTVAVAFGVVFVTEFLTGGANLPYQAGTSLQGGLIGLKLSSALLLRVIAYLPVLCGLMAAALIAIRGKPVPLTVYAYAGLPLLITAAARPDTVVLRWRQAPPVGELARHLDALATILCGFVAGLLIARVLAPAIYRGFDHSLLASDQQTARARQFLGAMGLVGALLGWQAIVPFTWMLAGVALTGLAASRAVVPRLRLPDVTVWVWLALLIFRASWQWWMSIQLLPLWLTEIVRELVGALMVVPCFVLYRKLADRAESPIPAEESKRAEETITAITDANTLEKGSHTERRTVTTPNSEQSD